MTVHPTIASHEAGHASGMLVQGLRPKLVRADNPKVDYYWSGEVEPDYERHALDPEMADDLVIATLLGPLAEHGRQWWKAIPPWPPPWEELSDLLNEEPRDSDGAQVATLIEYAQRDRSQYSALAGIALHWLDDAGFKSLHALIATALMEVPRITGSQLEELIGPERVARYLTEEVAA
ncbi:MAG: hypothetical protein ACRDMH_02840 [Solirubrobacterales bacterium]